MDREPRGPRESLRAITKTKRPCHSLEVRRWPARQLCRPDLEYVRTRSKGGQEKVIRGFLRVRQGQAPHFWEAAGQGCEGLEEVNDLQAKDKSYPDGGVSEQRVGVQKKGL